MTNAPIRPVHMTRNDEQHCQCQVMVRLAEELAAIDPELKKQYDGIEVSA